MQDILRERYDAIPYRHGSVPVSHPARLGAIGALHGLNVAAPDRFRVLEIGCAEGMNLLPLAERLPQSEFVGVDFSSAQIGVGEKARVAANLGNARLICADLREFEPEPESFDYVIAHGVYSWVGDEVKDRALAICSRALRSNGLAYMSYNTLPGWSLLAGLRKVLLTQMESENESEAKLQKGLAVIRALNESLAGQPGPYAELVRHAFSEMLAKPSGLLFHDELAEINDPCTFTDFTRHAKAHGLQYLAEAHYAAMAFDSMPESMRKPLEQFGTDFEQRQQFLDVVFQRWLRDSILCRADAPIRRDANSDVIRECALSLRVYTTESRVNLAPEVPMRLMGENDQVVEFSQSWEKAILTVLSQATPARIPFVNVIDAASRLLAQVNLPTIDDPAPACAFLFRLFSLGALDLVLAGSGEWLRTSGSPAPGALMKYQARNDLPVINRWHEPVTVIGEGKSWLAGDEAQPNEGAFRAGLLV
ncbi:MAG TPA: class I SAM-dependent methyltransferase [Chthoniobacteraceae bacterium]|nr:class I SAM-dependent methyltransferase [Chthoniobacteraceae bacterium]